MKVVLRTDVQGVGKRGDITEVSDGFARNFLVPQGRAIVADAGIADQAAAMRRSRDLKDARNREGAETVARKLVPIVFRIEARSGTEGRLFGSVTAADIVEAVMRQSGVELDRRRFGDRRGDQDGRHPRGGRAPPPGGGVPPHSRGGGLGLKPALGPVAAGFDVRRRYGCIAVRERELVDVARMGAQLRHRA